MSQSDSSLAVAREGYDELAADLAPLLEAHWRELAMWQEDVPLDPNWQAYRLADAGGSLRAYTVRQDGALIGYAIFHYLARHPHYAHRWAVNDIIWIAPEHRNFGVGTALCEFFEADLAAGQPIVIVVETKAAAPALAALLQARGYGLIGPTFGKRFA